MFKNKTELFNEIKQFQNFGSDIYIGKIEEIKKDKFFSNDLCVAGIVRIVNNDSSEIAWKQMQFKYVFERFVLAGRIYYREIFSGAVLEILDLNRLSNTRGMYIVAPIPYKEYSLYLKSKNDDEVHGMKKVRIP